MDANRRQLVMAEVARPRNAEVFTLRVETFDGYSRAGEEVRRRAARERSTICRRRSAGCTRSLIVRKSLGPW